MKVFAKLLKEKRKQAGLTQLEMANELKMTLYGYKSYEAGRRTPDLEAATRIAVILRVSLDELVGI